jgi:hypothetical protein
MDKKKEKMGLVVCLSPEQYTITDYRLNKPVCHQQFKNGSLSGSMLIQDIDEVSIKGKVIQYFSPNNIGLLLSISSSHIKKSEKIFKDTIKNMDYQIIKNKKEILNSVSSIICNYIEEIQIAIVFGYTALETFANLSIPEDYKYQKTNKTKGIHELYEKDSIERWLSLKEKIQYILTDIYKTEKTEKQKWWEHFSNFEQLRNDIIHQKTVKSTEFYKEYFKETIFKICKCPKEVIRFFYNAYEKNNQTNPIWPWIEGEKNTFPLNTKFNSQDFEVIGNIHDGIKKK